MAITLTTTAESARSALQQIDTIATQLEDLATLTRARMFDGRHDQEKAFRHARGYN